ncbi:MAG: cell division protein SepF [Lachnospiraceae bacterium]
MGVMDKILSVMRLNPEDDYEYDNEEYEDDYEEERKERSAKKANVYEDYEFEERRKSKDKPGAKGANKVTPMRPSKKQTSTGMEVCVIKPTSMDDAREITETLLLNRAVVLNVEGLDVEIAQRIIDFSSGSCFAIDGNLQKVSNYIFIITPSSVDISGDFQEIMSTFDVAAVQTDF